MDRNKALGCQENSRNVGHIPCGYVPYDGLIVCKCGMYLCDDHYIDTPHEGHKQATTSPWDVIGR